MSLLRTVTKLLFGETLLLPVGVGLVVGVSVAARALAREAWADYGAFAVFAGVVVVLVLTVTVTARRQSSSSTARRNRSGASRNPRAKRTASRSS